jgi:hypothetical protein
MHALHARYTQHTHTHTQNVCISLIFACRSSSAPIIIEDFDFEGMEKACKRVCGPYLGAIVGGYFGGTIALYKFFTSCVYNISMYIYKIVCNIIQYCVNIINIIAKSVYIVFITCCVLFTLYIFYMYYYKQVLQIKFEM